MLPTRGPPTAGLGRKSCAEYFRTAHESLELSQDCWRAFCPGAYNTLPFITELAMPKPSLCFPNLNPICPIDVLPEPLLSAVFYAIKHKEVPAICALTDALGAAGALVHCGYNCLTEDGDTLPATINTCAVAPSATGKGKSMRFFYSHFIKAKKSRVSEVPPTDSRIPVVERFVETITFRALMDNLNGQGMNLTIQREDGHGFLTTDLFKNNTDSLAQLWSGDPPLGHSVHGLELIAADARCSFGFRIQPDLMYDHFKGRKRLSYKLGFWPRTIAGCHDPERFPLNDTYLPFFIPETDPAGYVQRFEELAKEINDRTASVGSCRIEVPLSIEAKAMLLEIKFRMRGWLSTYYADIRESAGRAWENTLRLAVVLQVFCVGHGPVSQDMVARAWAIVEWSLSQHRLIFVEAIRPAVRQMTVKPATPKLPQAHQRRNADMQFMLEAIGARSPFSAAGRVRLNDVVLLTGFDSRRFMRALCWLVTDHLVVVEGADEFSTVRILPLQARGIQYGL